MDKADINASFGSKPRLEFFEGLLFRNRGVGYVAQTAFLDPYQMTKKITHFSDQATIGFIDTDEGLAFTLHSLANQLCGKLLPEMGGTKRSMNGFV
jgi:hypothetical protein